MNIAVKLKDVMAIDRSTRHHNSDHHIIQFGVSCDTPKYAQGFSFKVAKMNGVVDAITGNETEVLTAIKNDTAKTVRSELEKADPKLTDIVLKMPDDQPLKDAVTQLFTYFVSTPRP